MTNLSSVRSESLFAETASSLMESTLKTSEEMGAIFGEATVSSAIQDAVDASEGPAEKFGQQLLQVAKLIDIRSALGSERDVFYVELGGFDTHSDMAEILNEKLKIVNSILASFVDEMKSKGVVCC